MAQTLYGLVALLLVSLLALNMHQGTTHIQQRQVFNEVATQVTGVGAEVFEHIARDSVYFDKFVFDTRASFPVCGRTTSPAAFTEEAAFVPAASYAGSRYIEGFHGLTDVPIDRDGLPFLVAIAVRYVDPVTLAPAAAPTFAKEVALTITSPLLYARTPEHPIEVTMRRVLEYDTVTKAAYIPYTASGVCPPL
jgi:hypothetical protein